MPAETLRLRSSDDIILARQAVRRKAQEIGFSLVDETKIVTAASELARNTVIHGGGGTLLMEPVQNGTKRGLRLTFEDRGPGIPDIEKALQDGYTTLGGLGLGLGGARRLSSDFVIRSTVGAGTTVSITRWRA
jgi:serine/threonine-protein kinase RsbT